MKLFLITFFILNSALAFSQEAEFSFKKKTAKFPKVKEGDTLVHYFVYTNTGKAPLKIKSYDVECHCTQLFLPDREIMPGETDSLKMTFDTNGKYWYQDRVIIVHSNARKKETILRLKVYVIPKED